ncbi:MAG TPA: winged helix-turn-helix domain-containing tetratricopeptide repeat protein [Acidobacteriota bacterium]|jgi:TolB-like protein
MASGQFYQFGRFRLDIAGRLLLREGEIVMLPPKVVDTLLVLVQNAGRLVEKNELLKKVWPDAFVEEGSLARTISILRKALGDGVEGQEYILTIPKRGYRFVAPVKETPTIQPPSAAGRMMLAVLPFENLSSDPDQEYFSDGLTEEMITHLGRLHRERLGIIARTSAMKYKHTAKGIDQIGRELGVNYVLEGSVRRAGPRVRITAQLIQVSDQTHLWTESYDRNLDDILAVQNDVAQAIAGEIRVKLTSPERGCITDVRPVNPQAYEAYLKGRYFWNKRAKEGLQKAVGQFENAIETDPAYAASYAGLADCYLRLLDYNYLPPLEAAAQANAAAIKALQLNETLAEAHTSLGHLNLHQFNWEAAEKGFKRAIDLNPSYGTAHYYYANCLAALGRSKEAVAEAMRALELDPVAPSVILNAAGILFLARQYEQVIEYAAKTLELDPHYAHAYYFMGLGYEQKAAYGKAIAAFKKGISPAGRGVGAMAALAHACGMAGQRSDVLKLLKQLKDRSNSKYVSPYDFALLFLGLGEKDQAYEWLAKAYEERSSGLTFARVDPRLDVLRSHPRFLDLLRQMNFPP